MRREKETDKRNRGAGFRPPALLLVRTFVLPLSLLLLAVAGCAGDNRLKDDPMAGGDATPQGPAPGSLPVPGAPVAPGAPVPPLPVSSSALSTASLAGGTPLEGGRPLQIEEPRDTLVNRSTWQQAGAAAEKAASGAVLHNPEPIVPTGGRKDMDPVQGLTVYEKPGSDFQRTGGAVENYDQMMVQLKQRGMTDFSLDKWGEGVRLTCSVPKKDDPAKSRSYEAYSATATEAVKAILAKIDADK